MALATSQHISTTSELAVDCRSKACKGSTYLVAYSLPVSHALPTHCPCCKSASNTNKACNYRPADLADMIVLNNMGYSRKDALAILNWQRELVRYQKPGYTLSISELMVKHGVATMKYPYPTAYTPLLVACRSCGGNFTMLRGNPVPQSTPPIYCVWCGAPQLVIDQVTTEESAWLFLAAKYDLPVATIRIFYDNWVQRNTHVLFSDYMEAHTADVIIVRAVLLAEASK